MVTANTSGNGAAESTKGSNEKEGDIPGFLTRKDQKKAAAKLAASTPAKPKEAEKAKAPEVAPKAPSKPLKGSARAKAEFATLKYPGDDQVYGPHPVVLDVGDFVYISALSPEKLHDKVVVVTDGRSNGLDIHTESHCLLSVPAEWLTFISEGEALLATQKAA